MNDLQNICELLINEPINEVNYGQRNNVQATLTSHPTSYGSERLDEVKNINIEQIISDNR